MVMDILAIIIAILFSWFGSCAANIDPSATQPTEVYQQEGLQYTLVQNGYEVSSVGTYKKEKNIVIPSTYNGLPVTSIGDYAFYSCSLTSVTIPEGVTRIGNSAFEACHSLTSVTIPEGVTKIGNSAFDGCSNLSRVTLPDSLISIGNNAFAWSELTSVIIPDRVISIGSGAFKLCSELRHVMLPDSLVSIGSGAFSDCSHLDYINYAGTKAQWELIEISESFLLQDLMKVKCTDGVAYFYT